MEYGERRSENTIIHNKFSPDGSKIVPNTKLEIEGLHIIGDKIIFLIVPSSYSNVAVDKSMQYLIMVNKDYFK